MFKKILSCIVTMALSCLLFSAEEPIQLPGWFKPLASDQEVKTELSRRKELVNTYNEDGYTGLQRAVLRGDVKQTELFVQAGADINLPVKNKSKQGGDTALNLAISEVGTSNNTVLPDYLIEKRADVKKANAEGLAPIHRMLRIDDHDLRMKVAKELVKKGADINAQSKQGNTMLHLTVEKYDKKWIDMVKKEFGSSLDFNIKNNEGLTPLALAKKFQQFGDDSVVNSLLSEYELLGEGWGGYEKTNKKGQTGLMLAIYRDDPDFVKLMIQRGADINAQDKKGNTPLIYAVESERPVYYVKELLAKGAKVTVHNKKGETALMRVVDIRDPKQRIEVARLLIDAGAKLDTKDKQGNTIWHYAAKALDAELIEFLKKESGTVQKNKKGKTAVDVVRAKETKGLPKAEQEQMKKTLEALEV